MVGYGIVRPNTGWQLFSGKGVKRSSLSKKRVRKFVLAVLDPMPTVEAGEFNMKTWEIWLFRLINPKCGQLPKRLTFGRFRMLSNFWRLLSSVVFCSPGKNLTKYISCQGRGNITVTLNWSFKIRIKIVESSRSDLPLRKNLRHWLHISFQSIL